jgi:hypothetical protein
MEIPAHTGRMAPSACPACKYVFDAFTAIGHDNSPAPGSFTVCIGCGAVLAFREGEGFDVVPEEVVAAQPEETRSYLRYLSWASKVLRSVPKGAPFPPAYYLDAEVMLVAGRRWMREHPCAHVTFNQVEDHIMYIGALDEKGIDLLACSDDARDLLAFMDKACGNRGTVAQARAALSKLFESTTDA